ncbi:MAG TPA: cellobiose phosphorylase [Candidatus Eisenbacteria bacterium]|nr:cellobiose phosphorylase [Candidatus Eisenbacteria bacterium]
MRYPLWQFLDEEASFRVYSPEYTSRLYFPLANEAGLLSSITPDLHGDIKTGHNCFLTLPVTIEDLHNARTTRNFWAHIEGHGAWSLTGVSASQNADKFVRRRKEKVSLEAGMLWHKVQRENDELGLRSEIVNFAPATADTVELMIVTLTNTGRTKRRITPTSAVPIFGRSADNLRDHHHVTSLLHRIISHPSGVVVKPTMSFDERGHKLNEMLYGVLGTTGSGEPPVGSFYTVPDFVGEGGNLEAPQAILENLPTPQKDGHYYQGKPAVGALRFRTVTLAPREKASWVLILGIARKEAEVEEWVRRYGSLAKAEAALKASKAYWKEKADAIRVRTQDKNYNGWLRWVSLQPTFRKLFGCSFLPDFDYGRGGRGWRDLWQDCLALLLTSPAEAKQLLVNNFNGVRIDGSNATIIGAASGEFIADRNNITRVWMDHGVWPYLTLELYVHQSGDFDVLFQNARYFRDRQQSRATKKDPSWTEAYGQNLKDKKGRVVEGSLLEHLLVQHLVQFFNVGEHNHIRLENADWNDGLDMAYERGESVAFTCLYASNLRKLAGLLEEAAKRKGLKKIPLARELTLLLDRAAGKRRVDYDSAPAKHRRLAQYFAAVEPVVSGVKIEMPVARLAADLREKSEFIVQHVRQKEWLQSHNGEGLYNGYYDNHGRRVEGDSPQGLHMTLAGQTFPIMSGVADARQVEEIFRTARKHLKDKEHGGFRLNTNFNQIRLDLGRAFSFAYGEKENGAFFSHMAVMFANALYQRGFVSEGREVLDSIFRMCLRTEKSKIYPGIPEYFNSEGRGLYHYLTGSASWLILTVLTQVFGVRGQNGDLLLAPKFTQDDFREGPDVWVDTTFAGKRLRVVYRNTKKIPYGHYCVARVTVNGRDLKGVELNHKEILIPRSVLVSAASKNENLVLVCLE